MLLGAREARSKSLFWEWRYRIPGQVLNRSPILAMRGGPWKLLMNPDGSRKELYRIGEDPMELQNLADRQTDVVESMSESLRQWYATLPEAPIDEDAGKAEWAWPK